MKTNTLLLITVAVLGGVILGGLLPSSADGQVNWLRPAHLGNFQAPAFDSGWVALSPGQLLMLTHNLGGNIDKYHVDFQTRSDPAAGSLSGLHNVGNRGGSSYGAYYYALGTSSVALKRQLGDTNLADFWQSPEVRFRVWVTR